MTSPSYVSRSEAIATPGIKDALSFAFDFELLVEPIGPRSFAIDAVDCLVIAVDATGGSYAECSDSANGKGRSIYLYVDGRGRAGVLAEDFPTLLRLVVDLPQWREVLDYSSFGNLEQMRLAARLMEEDLRDDLPFFEEARGDILASLNLPDLPDPVAHLHRFAVGHPRPKVMAFDGSLCDDLAGRRSVADNSEWAKRLRVESIGPR